jgi:hypothetical protein
VVALGVAVGCYPERATFFTQLDDSRRLAADLRLQFNRAADASNRAVMADTDEASIAFSGEAEQVLQLVEKDVVELTPLLQRLGFSNEIQALEAFGKHFVEYRELDRTILSLAVENSNLKAQRLAFGPAREGADAFRDALAVVASSIPPDKHCSGEALILKATLAVCEVQVLHAPHIAERNDEAMTYMEHEMANRNSDARAALSALAELVPSSVGPALAAALAALDRFKDISGQIVLLSRRNTNVRSLELSLRTKPALTAACDGSLIAIQDLLAKEGIKATR